MIHLVPVAFDRPYLLSSGVQYIYRSGDDISNYTSDAAHTNPSTKLPHVSWIGTWVIIFATGIQSHVIIQGATAIIFCGVSRR